MHTVYHGYDICDCAQLYNVQKCSRNLRLKRFWRELWISASAFLITLVCSIRDYLFKWHMCHFLCFLVWYVYTTRIVSYINFGNLLYLYAHTRQFRLPYRFPCMLPLHTCSWISTFLRDWPLYLWISCDRVVCILCIIALCVLCDNIQQNVVRINKKLIQFLSEAVHYCWFAYALIHATIFSAVRDQRHKFVGTAIVSLYT